MRPLIVMIDADVVRGKVPSGQAQYLLELLAVESVIAYQYADEGPPPEAPRHQPPSFNLSAVDGWIVTRRNDEGSLEVLYSSGGKVRDTRLSDFRVKLALDSKPALKSSCADPSSRIRSDVVAALVAESVHADIFVTERSFLFDDPSLCAVTTLRPEEAVPVVGLYLRLLGHFILGRSPAVGQSAWSVVTSDSRKGEFYWWAAQELLPASQRWFDIARHCATEAGDDTLSMLVASLVQRVDQTLRARDQLLATLSVPQGDDPVDDLLSDLDQILLFLMAAFDVAAQIAHLALHIKKPKIRYAQWQSHDWLIPVRAEAPKLAALLDPNSDGKHVLTIISKLRNSIHREALEAVGVLGTHLQLVETMVELPLSFKDRDSVRQAIELSGGHERWGAQPVLSPFGNLEIHPGEFVELMLPRAVILLDALLAAIPVELIVSESFQSGSTTLFQGMDHHGRRVLWQLGL